MKKANIILVILVSSGMIFLTNCQKNLSKENSLIYSAPVYDANNKLIGTNSKTFSSPEEFKNFIEQGLKEFVIEKKGITRHKKTKLAVASGIFLDYDDNPCGNNSPFGEGGQSHQLSESFTAQTPIMNGVTLGLSVTAEFSYNTNANGVNTSGMGIGVNVTGQYTPNSQTTTGHVVVNGTTISTSGYVLMTWSAGYSTTSTTSTSTGVGTSAGGSVGIGPVSVNANGSGSYSSTVTNSTTYSGTTNVTASLGYQINEDICGGHGTATFTLNGQPIGTVYF